VKVALKELRSVDIKRAQLVPSSVFASPDEVLETGELTLPQKLAILRRWEFDARRVAVVGEASMLRRIQGALETLSPRKPVVTPRQPTVGSALTPLTPLPPAPVSTKRILKL
jgi:hypothetical protein